ncbi:3-deoxy-7-phosphoheptulonate synthase [Chloroflexota bacterium]
MLYKLLLQVYYGINQLMSKETAMIVAMKKRATKQEIDNVVNAAHSLGFDVQLNVGSEKTVIAILGSATGQFSVDTFGVMPNVDSVTRIMNPYKLPSREFKPEDSVFDINGIKLGGKQVIVMAGPCAVESEEQILETAKAVKEAGATILRGGAFKPRTSPFSFQGLEKAGLEILAKAGAAMDMPVVTEVMDPRDVELVMKYATILQIGARNMQNYSLLREVGKAKRPTVLKRSLAATITEWFSSADYLLAEGNKQVILCERGIRTFEDTARFSLDVCAIGNTKRLSHLPLIVDPSHAAGHFELVPSLAKAAVAAGADGLMIEVHPNPQIALVDGLQSLNFSNFQSLMAVLKKVAQSVDRDI